MNDDRRIFVHRIAWAILPGFISGLLVAGMAYGAITVRLEYVVRDINHLRIENKEQNRKIQRNREMILRDEVQ